MKLKLTMIGLALVSAAGAFHAQAVEYVAETGMEHLGTIGGCYITDVYGTQCLLVTLQECQAYANPDRDVTVDWRVSGCSGE